MANRHVCVLRSSCKCARAFPSWSESTKSHLRSTKSVKSLQPSPPLVFTLKPLEVWKLQMDFLSESVHVIT